MCELPAVLAAHGAGAGYVIAPAGHGKTHLIAESTSRGAGRQLSSDAHIRGRECPRQKDGGMLSVSGRLYHIDTIASWALRSVPFLFGHIRLEHGAPEKGRTVERVV